MMLEILGICLFGIVIGVFAGIIPGMHINTLLPFILFLGFWFKMAPHYVAILIVSTSVTEIFVNFISSIFIGAPEANTALSVLPGHKLLLEGRGYEAIKLTVIGGIGGLILTLAIISIFSLWFKALYKFSRAFIHWVIMGFVIFMIVSERKLRKILFASLIFLISGIFGFICLNSSLVSQENVLFPILTGFFGLSTLIISVSETSKIPKQEDDNKLKISKKEIAKSMFLGSVAGIFAGFLPAVGISEVASIAQYIGKMSEARSFLITLSGINIGNEVFSLISLYLVSNPRSGPSVALQRILGEINFFEVILFIGIICFSSGIAALLTLFLGKKIPKYLEKINYRILCLVMIIFLIFMIFLLTGIFGLLIAFTSTSIGLLCNYLKVRRSHCMGCLLFASILFFSGLDSTLASFLSL